MQFDILALHRKIQYGTYSFFKHPANHGKAVVFIYTTTKWSKTVERISPPTGKCAFKAKLVTIDPILTKGLFEIILKRK